MQLGVTAEGNNDFKNFDRFKIGRLSPVAASSQVDRVVDSLIPPPHIFTEALSGFPPNSAVESLHVDAAVLEGNFIYWMTGAYLAAKSDEARQIISENLHEEVRDCHPNMLRKFSIAANAVPKDSDALAVYRDLTEVRLFIGRLSDLHRPDDGLLRRFHPTIHGLLSQTAIEQGSTELEYTDVHGVCDIAHT